jgi:hypothetical protein
MARRYSADGQTAAGTNLTIAEVVAATTTRAWIYDIIIGSDATPADVATEFNLIRGTVSGTPTTTVTPRALDPGNPASLLTLEVGTFTGQTKTSNSAMLNIALNQRATFRWVAVPDGEIVVPATSDNWVGLESIASGGTPNINVTFSWQE